LGRPAAALDALLASWLARYRVAPGAADELLGADGRPREHWLALLGALARLGEADIDQRFAGANRRIDEMGVTYRAPGEARERVAPLSRLPLLLPQAEWEAIEAGIVQRAELLDLILRDIYGEGRLIEDGALPATAVTGSPEFIRPMRGVAPPGGRWLRFYAAEIARGPDGAWRVLGDRAQAPSGAGYALENRLVMARAVPSLFRDMNLRRLAPFFRDFRAGLASCAQRVDPRICLLTPGPFSETCAEEVNLARYLGLLLVEGEDLLANDGKLYVRTIAGLKRADVLWRRVDADWCDPLELNTASKLGAPGLLEAIRQGAVAVANMPGAGLVEARAIMSFLPALARRLLGEELRLPNVETLWCGDDGARARVLASLDKRRVKDAFTPAPMFRTTFPSAAPRSDGAHERRGARETRRGDDGARHGFRGAGGADLLDHAGLGRWRLDAAPLRAARFRGGDEGRLAGDARRLLPRLRPAGRRGAAQCRRALRRCLCSARDRSKRRRCCRPPETPASCACSGVCPAAPPTICSGWGAIWSAPKRCCASCAAYATASPRRRRRAPRRTACASASRSSGCGGC
jgi:uncharacterized circularly permuted ATP-grasp superfamily protein